jgi:hypothetical protein
MMLPFARYVALPAKWPGRKRAAGWRPKRSPFKGHNWSRIEKEVLEEIARINGRDVTIALDIRNPGHFRPDGGIRADARPVTSAVVVSFTRPDGRRLVFPCDAYAFWQDNVWAVRLSLEALRAVDRHGVTAGDQQYEGFAALPSGGNGKMSEEAARTLLAELSGFEESALAFPSVFAIAVQRARSKAHPDVGGSTDGFQKLEEAIGVLGALEVSTS